MRCSKESNNKFYHHRYNTDCKHHSYPAFTLSNSPVASDPAPESHSGSQTQSNFPTHFAIECKYNQCKDRVDTGNEYFVAIRHHKIKLRNRSQGGNNYKTDTDLYEPSIDPDKEEDYHCSNELAAP